MIAELEDNANAGLPWYGGLVAVGHPSAHAVLLGSSDSAAEPFGEPDEPSDKPSGEPPPASSEPEATDAPASEQPGESDAKTAESPDGDG